MQPNPTLVAVSPASFGEHRLPIRPSSVDDKLHRSIDAEVAHIIKQQARGKGRQIIESSDDKADVIKRYRAIDSLVRQLQVSTQTFITREKPDRWVERRCSSNLGQHEEVRPGMKMILESLVGLRLTSDW
jgi:hypothetical protein